MQSSSFRLSVLQQCSQCSRNSSSNGSNRSNLVHEHVPAATARLSSTRRVPLSQESAGQRDLRSYSVAELRKVAVHLGVSLDGCLEKKEMIQRIGSALGRPEATDSMSGTDCLDSLMSNMSLGAQSSAGGDGPATLGVDAVQTSPSCRPSAASIGLRPGSPLLSQAGSAMVQQ